jgi:hypothetical protein
MPAHRQLAGAVRIRKGACTAFLFCSADSVMHYALIFIMQFWLQQVPYADLNGDNFVNFNDFKIACRLINSDLWVSKFNWFCVNHYSDGHTETVEGFTYNVWLDKPVKYDRHPEVPGFRWLSRDGKAPIASANYIFFERMFPALEIKDANRPVYVPPVSYDLNSDGFLDIFDLEIFCSNWLYDSPLNPCDFNRDLIVNFRDLNAFVYHWCIEEQKSAIPLTKP